MIPSIIPYIYERIRLIAPRATDMLFDLDGIADSQALLDQLLADGYSITPQQGTTQILIGWST